MPTGLPKAFSPEPLIREASPPQPEPNLEEAARRLQGWNRSLQALLNAGVADLQSLGLTRRDLDRLPLDWAFRDLWIAKMNESAGHLEV